MSESNIGKDGLDELIKTVTEKLERYKFTKIAHSGEMVGYTKEGAGYDGLSALFTVPEKSFEMLDQQLKSRIVPLSEHFGYTAPSEGKFEIAVRRIGRIGRLFDPMLRSLPSAGKVQCKHSSGHPLPSLDPQEYNKSRLSKGMVGKIHVADPEETGCIELSWASPCGVLWGLPNGRNYDFDRVGAYSFRAMLTLKIELEDPGDPSRFEERCLGLVNAFLYEMSVRNGISFEPVRQAEYYSNSPRSPRVRTEASVRFPETRIQPEIAELFFFAGGARENPSLSFLSYYQILEYFFPYAVRREVIRRVRKEISDPRFNKSADDSILKILAAAEVAVSASEAKQIATLIDNSVRAELLEEFFTNGSWADHFTSKGPISSVEPINLKNSQKSLPSQVADRIYRIRNRIVHAKDDPKYADVRVLLPKSREAYALGPDIALLKFLAEEVVLDSQV
ncbi:hypothetical protein [Streptomyces echinatus]|uniref:hypothetical protein n=1 Tax=Streptomyces echinatus TaxID=67293 RepID=UPI0037944C78